MGRGQQEGSFGIDHHHADDLVVVRQIDAAHAGGVASGSTHLTDGKADRLPLGGSQNNVVVVGRLADLYQAVALLDVDGDQSVAADVAVAREERLLDGAVGGGEEDRVVVVKLTNPHQGIDLLLRLQFKEVDDRLAGSGA